MDVKLRERPRKGWYVLTDWNGQRKAKYFGKDKKAAKTFADKLTARLKWAEQSGEPLALSQPVEKSDIQAKSATQPQPLSVDGEQGSRKSLECLVAVEGIEPPTRGL